MMWLFAILIVLAMGGVALVASGRTGALPEEYDDRPDARVPAGVLQGSDLRRVRFSLAFRGYRMSEVDTLLALLADQLDARAEADAETADQTADETPDEPADDLSHGGRDVD
jgi:DivIVA domain-containing protein